MKLPQLPPSPAFPGNLEPEFIQRVLSVPGPAIERFNTKYVHWDKLRRYPASELGGFTPEEVWSALKMFRRATSVTLPLRDTSGTSFWFSSQRIVQFHLHQIDQALGGMLLSDIPNMLGSERERYLVNSLMEEAIASSQLEGASTTRQKAKSMLRKKRNPKTRAEQMIVNNYGTISWLRERVNEELDIPAITEVHERMTTGTLDEDDTGRLRSDWDNVHVVDHATGNVTHVPPPAAELEERLQALCVFANQRSDPGNVETFVHPVIRAIVIHFWLAYDHPFVDGNGRTARALFYWSMLRSGYWMFEFLPISRIILKAPSQYSRAYLESERDEGDLTYFLVYNLRCISKAKDELREYLTRKQDEAIVARSFLRSAQQYNSRQQEVLSEALRDEQRSWTIEEYASRFVVTAQTARRDLYALTEQGLFRKFKQGRAFAFEPTPRVRRLSKRGARNGT